MVRRTDGEMDHASAVRLAFCLYLATIAPGVAGEDAGEFQFVPYIFGLPHPTGYPLYILFGKLWTMIVPIGTIAYRMNLLAAIAAALAVALTFRTVLLVSEHIAAGLIAAITLATSG
jgi:Protein of unknown function (DUF2723)